MLILFFRQSSCSMIYAEKLKRLHVFRLSLDDAWFVIFNTFWLEKIQFHRAIAETVECLNYWAGQGLDFRAIN